MTRADTCLFEHLVTRAVVASFLLVCLSSFDRILMFTSAYGSIERSDWRHACGDEVLLMPLNGRSCLGWHL